MKYIIGDIHGCYFTLIALIDKIYKKDSEAEIIFTGDFVDRGPASKEVLEYILPRIESGEFRAVRGNHEEIMYNGVNYPFGANWEANGGDATIKSYKGDTKLMAEHASIVDKLPLYLIFENENSELDGRILLVSHSFCADFIDEYIALYGGSYEENVDAIEAYEEEYGLLARYEITKNADLINWNRRLPSGKDKKYFNITGHNITGHLLENYNHIDGYDEKTEVIIDRKKGYACIDTGAFIDERYESNFGGRLTAISFPGLEVIQQKNIDKVQEEEEL